MELVETNDFQEFKDVFERLREEMSPLGTVEDEEVERIWSQAQEALEKLQKHIENLHGSWETECRKRWNLSGNLEAGRAREELRWKAEKRRLLASIKMETITLGLRNQILEEVEAAEGTAEERTAPEENLELMKQLQKLESENQQLTKQLVEMDEVLECERQWWRVGKKEMEKMVQQAEKVLTEDAQAIAVHKAVLRRKEEELRCEKRVMYDLLERLIEEKDLILQDVPVTDVLEHGKRTTKKTSRKEKKELEKIQKEKEKELKRKKEKEQGRDMEVKTEEKVQKSPKKRSFWRRLFCC